MKLLIASVAFLLCLTSATLCAQEPETDTPSAEAKLVLVAPSHCRVGELVRLDVSDSTADSFQWVLVPESHPDFLTYDNGARAVFSARTEGDYRFIIACAKNGTVNVVTHVITVVGPPPMPVSDSLAEWIPFWNWAEMLPLDECQRLADSFESIAARADELDTPEKWLQATSISNRETLGDRIDRWKPMLDKIGAALRKKAETGALTTPEEHAKAWLEIAEGLRNC